MPLTSLPKSHWRIKLLYDGECPLCLREVNFLKKKDRNQGLIAFIDISDENYQPVAHKNIDYETAMGRIHAILADGTVITDIEVFRQVYEILGIGWMYAATRNPLIEKIANIIYRIWANLRLRLAGRPELEILIVERQKKLNGQPDNKCRLNSQPSDRCFDTQQENNPILCPHCQRTASNGIKCKGICVADSDY